MTDIHTVTEGIKSRTEALILTASVNSAKAGGDNANAAMDLMMAFVLITMRSGGNPEKCINEAKDHAIFAAAEFWGKNGRRADA